MQPVDLEQAVVAAAPVVVVLDSAALVVVHPHLFCYFVSVFALFLSMSLWFFVVEQIFGGSDSRDAEVSTVVVHTIVPKK